MWEALYSMAKSLELNFLPRDSTITTPQRLTDLRCPDPLTPWGSHFPQPCIWNWHYYYVGIADPSIVVWTLPEGTTEDHINYEHGYDEPEAPVEDGYSSRASLVAAQSRML